MTRYGVSENRSTLFETPFKGLLYPPILGNTPIACCKEPGKPRTAWTNDVQPRKASQGHMGDYENKGPPDLYPHILGFPYSNRTPKKGTPVFVNPHTAAWTRSHLEHPATQAVFARRLGDPVLSWSWVACRQYCKHYKQVSVKELRPIRPHCLPY